jgi:uncharacterized protein (TIGR02453 family)
LKNELIPFSGFNKDIFNFFSDLEKNNNVEWFHKNKERYQNNVVTPTKAFISDLAPFLNQLNPAIRTEPKFNETIMRINKDMRFSKGDPYRNYWLIHFGKFKLDSEFFIYFDSVEAAMGIFINRLKEEHLYFRNNLEKYPKEIKEVFSKYKINNQFSFYYFAKMNPTKLISKFDAAKHFEELGKHDMFLLQNVKKIPTKILFSDKILLEMINMISQLYPLYCFAISPQPLKELQRFEDNFGEVV